MRRFAALCSIVVGIVVSIVVAATSFGTVATSARSRVRCASIDCLRINQLQTIGTHNSYKVQPEPDVFALIQAFSPALAATLQYSHAPLATQLTQERVRQVELDVWADPAGGRYSSHQVNALLGKPVPSSNADLYRPGLKVFHVPEVGYRSRYTTFVACLRQIRAWSLANPDHLPLAILVEAKEDPVPDPANLGFAQPLPFDAAQLDEIDREIRSVVPASQLITPDTIRGQYPTLEQAVLAGNAWPTVGEARGKLLFLLDNENKRDLYLQGHPSLRGRVMFTASSPGQPDAAFIKDNDPLGADGLEWQRIQGYVAAGYVVRTRADADTIQARTGDTTMRDAALRSGAQWVSTDYATRLEISPFATGYFVEVPGGGVARCNPVNGPFRCTIRAG